jgi:hypothetical protein
MASTSGDDLGVKELREELERLKVKNSKLEEETRPLNLQETLRLWHTSHGEPTVEIRDTKAQQTPLTNPEGKFRPRRLVYWDKFPDFVKDGLNQLEGRLKQASAQLPSVHGWDSKLRSTRKRVGNEQDVSLFLSAGVEEIVTMLSGISGVPLEWRSVQRYQDRIRTAVSERCQAEAQEQGDGGSAAAAQSGTPSGQRVRIPDKVCFVFMDGEWVAIFVIEFKASDVGKVELWRAGLHEMEIESVFTTVLFSAKDKEIRSQENAKLYVAQGMCQLFSYMLASKLRYGAIACGTSYVYTYIDEANPDDLYYYLAEPKDAGSGDSFKPYLTAVGMMLGFAEAASAQPEFRQEAFEKYERVRKVWPTKKELLKHYPPSPIAVPPLSKAALQSPGLQEYRPSSQRTRRHTTDAVSSSSGVRKSQRIQSMNANPYPADETNCKTEAGSTPNDKGPDDDDDSEDHSNKRGFPQPRFTQHAKTAKGGDKKQSRAGHSGSGGGNINNNVAARDRAFCTQRCLLGLVYRLPMDPACPNFAEHQTSVKPTDVYPGPADSATPMRARHAHRRRHHPYGVLKLLDEQLRRATDRGLTYMNRHGRSGFLFKVTLHAHGYTFVGKGTVRALRTAQLREAAVYRHLQHLQGQAVPVLLGFLDLAPPVPLLGGVLDLASMLFMSWGGCEAWRAKLPQAQYVRELRRTLYELEAAGVQHGDVAERNVLWNAELQRALVIDFEWDVLIRGRRVSAKSAKRPHENGIKRRAMYAVQRRKVYDYYGSSSSESSDDGCGPVFYEYIR